MHPSSVARDPRPPFRPLGVVLDLDGLLVDSEGAWARAERTVVTDLGHVWDPAIHTLLLGTAPAVSAARLAEHLGTSLSPDEVGRRLDAAASTEFATGVGPRPGAVALVTGLAGTVPVGVATNSPRHLAEDALRAVGLRDAVDVLVTSEDVVRPKPAADPYLTACGVLRVEPGRTMAFEDSPVGVQAARAAGLWVVGCPSVPGEDLAAAHGVVATLEAVDLDWFVEGQPASRPLPASA